MKMSENLKTYIELLRSNEDLQITGRMFRTEEGQRWTVLGCCAVGLMDVAEYAGVLEQQPPLNLTRVAALNDGGMSFGEIAEVLLEACTEWNPTMEKV